MKDTLKITVITVVKNGADRLRATIDSVVSQDYDNIEYIIKDGGSTDGTVDIIKEYADHYDNIRYMTSADQGIYDAMNTGLDMSSGDVIEFLNAGDRFVERDVVSRAMMSMVENDADIVYGDIIYINANVGSFRRAYPKTCSLKIYYLTGDVINHQVIFAKRKLFEGNRFDISYRICADMEWLLRIRAYRPVRKMVSLGFPVAYYPVDGVSAIDIDRYKQEVGMCIKKHIPIGYPVCALFEIVRSNRITAGILHWFYERAYTEPIVNESTVIMPPEAECADTALSIIIPHYNIPELLVRMLKSIPDRPDIETIVVDDCSTVSLRDLEQYIHDRNNVSMYKTDHNGGAGAARNIGLGHATGKWVLFADSDDRFVDGFFETVSKFFSSDNDVVYFTACSEQMESNDSGTRHVLLNDTVLAWINNRFDRKKELDLRFRLNGPVCKLINMSFIRKHGLRFEEVSVSNDEMFSTMVGYHAKRIDASEKAIYCITERRGSLAKVTSRENFWIRLEVFIRKYAYLKEYLTKEDFKLLDLSSQEKVFSMLQNRYGMGYYAKVIKRLRDNHVRFLTCETFKPSVLKSKLRTAKYLQDFRKKECQLLVQDDKDEVYDIDVC